MDCKDLEDVVEDMVLEWFSMKTVAKHGIKRDVSLPNKAMFDQKACEMAIVIP